MASQVQVQHLFSPKRLKEDWDDPEFLLYFPLGVVLLALRITIALILCPLLLLCDLLSTRQVRVGIRRQLAGPLLGLRVAVVNPKQCFSPAKILVANHCTFQDQLAMELALPCTPLLISSKLPWIVRFLLGCSEISLPSPPNPQQLDTLIARVSVPLLVFPEETTTNGKVGLLKFAEWPFATKHLIQPVSIRISGPLLNHVSLNYLRSNVWWDLLWMLFLPGARYDIKFHNAVEASGSQEAETLAKHAQEVLAQDLGLVATDFTPDHKFRLISSQHQLLSQPSGRPHTSLGMTPEQAIKLLGGSTLTFAQRKELLIAEARQKYLAKHAKLAD